MGVFESADMVLADDALQVTLDESAEKTPPRDLVYRTGSWERYLWAELLEENVDAADAVRSRYPGTEWPSLVREMFSRLYGTAARLEEVPLGAEWAEPLHEAAGQLPEWIDLAAECRGDDELSSVAAVQIQQELELPDNQEPPDDPTASADDAAEHGGEGSEGSEGKAADAHAKTCERIEQARAMRAALSQPGQASALRRTLRGVLRRALADARGTKAAMAMLGCGSQPSTEEKRAWRHAIHENPDLVKIAALAGRMEAALEAERAEVQSDLGKEDLVGLKLGSSIAESVPMERALFDHPILGLLQVAKMSEGRLLQNRQVGLIDDHKAGQGPLIFACDESGSMRGGEPSRDVVAKAIALTLARRCAIEGRTFAYLHWSSVDEHKASVYPQGAGLNATITDELTHYYGGGTDLPGAIKKAAGIVRGEQPEMPADDAERADVVLITDARHHEHGKTEKALAELGATGARLFVFHVDDGEDHPKLKEHAVRYVRVTGSELNDGREIALAVHNQLEDP